MPKVVLVADLDTGNAHLETYGTEEWLRNLVLFNGETLTLVGHGCNLVCRAETIGRRRELNDDYDDIIKARNLIQHLKFVKAPPEVMEPLRQFAAAVSNAQWRETYENED